MSTIEKQRVGRALLLVSHGLTLVLCVALMAVLILAAAGQL